MNYLGAPLDILNYMGTQEEFYSRVKYNHSILYVSGWHANFNTLYLFFKTLMTILYDF